MRLNKKLVQMFFVKSHESKISIIIDIVQEIHIQYMSMYFIKFCNFLNNLRIMKPRHYSPCNN
jgi:hypothetical protein